MQGLGPRPVRKMCPVCKKEVETRIQTKPGIFAWVICGFLILFGCWLGCCLIPLYCVDSLKVTQHFCPECKTLIGTYSGAEI